VFVLDRACLQFEPDDHMYQDVTATTYEAVERGQHYSSLRSTRHFGPFAFHLAWNRSIDNLLLDLIQTDRYSVELPYKHAPGLLDSKAYIFFP
jgi:small subunit ribosomal protein S22